MATTKTVWGIDVGQCALKALKLQMRDGKLRALSFDVIDHAKILSQPDADEQALIRSALSKFLSRNAIKGSALVISVPGQASFTRFIKLPPVEMRKIPEIVRYEARQQIPFDLEDVVWDYQTISPPSAGPREVEVGIFAMKRDIVADYVSDFLAMKIEPDIVQMAPVALYNYLRYDQQVSGGGATILLDVGGENTNLVIADGERVWIRNVPLGGNNFTQALCKEFKLQFSKAENLKRHAAESKHARQVFQAMRPIFGDLLTEIQRSIGYYTSLHRDSRIERIVALGNAFRLPGLTKFLSQNLGVDVAKVEGFETLGDAEALSAPLFRENVLSFGVAFGLALQGLGMAQISTSLLPPEILSTKVMKRKRPFFVAAGAAVLAAVGAFAYDQMATSSDLNANEAGRQSATVRKLKKDNATWQGKFDEQKDALVEQQKTIGEVESLIENQAYAYQLMRTVWDAWPHDETWGTYDPWLDEPPRSTLRIIEMLSLTMYPVPDVRAYSEQVKGGSGVADKITVVGHGLPPPAGDETPPDAAQEPSAPVPGVLVEITGITPKTGSDGRRFVEEKLIANLRNCRRTIELETPDGKETLAMMPSVGVFRNNQEYQVYGRRRTTRRKTKAGEAAPEERKDDKSKDFWFKAQWVVGVGPLPESLRRRAFEEVAALTGPAGLDDPRMIDRARAQGADVATVARIEGALADLARTWLVSRRDLCNIAVEGVTKEWAGTAPPTVD